MQEPAAAKQVVDSQAAAPSADLKKQDPKQWARMRAKVNRLCGMTPAGKLQVHADIHQLFMKGGTTKDDLILMMNDADGDRDTSPPLQLCKPLVYVYS